jgi:PEP-CTERM motif
MDIAINERCTRGRIAIAALGLAGVLSGYSATASAGSILVSNDEWMFSDGLLTTVDNTKFAKNSISWLTGGVTSGSVLILSNNFGLTGSGYTSLLSGMGYTVSVTTSAPASLSGYSAVLVAGLNVDNTLLTNYVNGGGSVFLEAGTGSGGAASEAAQWNTFLNTFGLGLAPTYNGISGNTAVTAFSSQPPFGPALFAGVGSIYMNNGNNVVFGGASTSKDQIFNDPGGNGLFGAWSSTSVSVPEPETLGMVLLGSGLMGFMVRRRRDDRKSFT